MTGEQHFTEEGVAQAVSTAKLLRQLKETPKIPSLCLKCWHPETGDPVMHTGECPDWAVSYEGRPHE